MKMSRQGPGALWKSNSWSTTAVAMVDTHSIAHCAALRAKGIKTPALLLGRVSSPLLQRRLFVSVIVVPRIRRKKSIGAKPSKEVKALRRGRKLYLLSEVLPGNCGSVWQVSGFSRGFSLPSSHFVLVRCYGRVRWMGQSPTLSTESKIFAISSALIQAENSQMSESLGTSHGSL